MFDRTCFEGSHGKKPPDQERLTPPVSQRQLYLAKLLCVRKEFCPEKEKKKKEEEETKLQQEGLKKTQNQ